MTKYTVTLNSRLPVSLPFKPAKDRFPCHLGTNSCLLGNESDLLYVDLVPPPSHFSHLILEQYQDSDLPLTSTEGTDTEGHTLHFITQRQAMVACQTIPLAHGQKPRTAAMSWINRSPHSNILSAVYPCTHVPACIMNSFRDTPSFYSEEKGSPITLSSFLQLNTDQLMTTNETPRDIHTGILEGCWGKEERSEMDNKLWIATHSKFNSREALSHSHLYWYLLKLATQAKVAGLVETIYFTLLSRCQREMSWDSNSNQSNQSGTQCLVLPRSILHESGEWKRGVKQSTRRERCLTQRKKEREESVVEGGGVTHGSCHPSTSSFPCASQSRPQVHRLHSAPLPAAPAAAAAGASARKTCLPLKLAPVLQHRVAGHGECCPTLWHISHSCTERSETTTTRPPSCSASLGALALGHDTKAPGGGGHTLTADTPPPPGWLELSLWGQ